MSGVWGDGWASHWGTPPAGTPPQASDRLTRALVALLLAATGLPEGDVRPADQNAPRETLSGEFATLKIIDSEPMGQPEAQIQNDPTGDIIEAVSVTTRLTVSVNFWKGRKPADADAKGIPTFTTAAYGRAQRLRTQMAKTAVFELARDIGLGFLGASDARNLSGLSDGSLFESRGHVDLYFSAVMVESSAATSFASGSFSGVYEGPDGTQRTIPTTEVTP